MQHVNDIALDREHDAIHMLSTTVQQLPDFDRRVSILRSQRAAGRKMHEGADS
jgi:hypothetical protein